MKPTRVSMVAFTAPDVNGVMRNGSCFIRFFPSTSLGKTLVFSFFLDAPTPKITEWVIEQLKHVERAYAFSLAEDVLIEHVWIESSSMKQVIKGLAAPTLAFHRIRLDQGELKKEPLPDNLISMVFGETPFEEMNAC